MKNIMLSAILCMGCISVNAMDSATEVTPEAQPVAKDQLVVTIQNPCFQDEAAPVKKSKKKSQRRQELNLNDGSVPKQIKVVSGSTLLYSADGAIGAAIKLACGFSKVENPNKITHAGIAVVESPRMLHNLILELMPADSKVDPHSELDYDEAIHMLQGLLKNHRSIISSADAAANNVMVPFALEANGSASDVLSGLMPHVYLTDLSQSIRDYKGNVFLRNIKEPVARAYTTEFMREHLGRSYEVPGTLLDLFRSVEGTNRKERTENVFCSELVAMYYKGAGIVAPSVNASNVVPAMLSVRADEYDVLQGKAGEEIPLKLTSIPSYDDIVCGCWG